MDFEENVEKLSEKYNVPRGKVYDLMAVVQTAVGIVRPMEALRNKEVFDRKVYLIANSQLREKYATKSEYKPAINHALENQDRLKIPEKRFSKIESQEGLWPEIPREDYFR